MEIKSKNSKLLKSFVKYAEAHPEMRLWQALRAWSGVHFLVAEHEVDAYTRDRYDTYFWEKKNELPKSNPKKN